MVVVIRLLVLALLAVLLPSRAGADTDATLFRIFLNDGATVVSYGEYARVNDRVIFSMPAGGTAGQPRLHVVSLPADTVNWERTEQYAASARYQRYAATRGEADFQLLTNEVARVLNDIALNTDRARALELAREARRRMADWPQKHFGYRQDDVREIVGLLDEAINGLAAAAGAGSFDLSLVAAEAPVALEPVLGMPTPREQLDQLFHLAAIARRPADRVALLQSALVLLNEPATGLPEADIERFRRSAEQQIKEEASIDRKYAKLSERLMKSASRAAKDADVADVERVLNKVAVEDARLGHKREETVQALRASLSATLASARKLRLMKDQWELRRSIYENYEDTVGEQVVQLVKLQPMLESIRKLEGPTPERLSALRARLSGGAERLSRLTIPSFLQSTHDLLVTAWRFAEQAANARYAAVASGSLTTAWEASSAAAGAMMMLSRAQEEIRSLIEPPRLE